MSKIHLLSDTLITKIAAGEVIERPSFAVKELVENALDAQADQIEVIIEKSGLKKIKVVDNGQGMDLTDLLESYKPHTTSKITQESDLYSIKTFGFRGEALSSLAAVSDLEIVSRTINQPGGEVIVLKNNQLIKNEPIGAAVGTSVNAANLFAAIPARQKFLKSPLLEFRQIVQLMTAFALVNPLVKFKFVHNQKTIFDLEKTNNLLSRIKFLLGENIYQNSLPINLDEGFVKISGFVIKPQIKYSQNRSYMFINSRLVSDKLISTAVRDAYGNLLSSKEFPVFILFLDLAPEMLDVNVHPRKEQVNFIDNALIYNSVFKAVTETLQQNNLTFTNLSWKKDFESTGQTNSFAAEVLKEESFAWQSRSLVINPNSEIIQIHNLYLTIQSPDGLILIDQHAAHERILYQQFLNEFKNKQLEIISLSTRQHLELAIADAQFLEQNLPIFKKIGFTIEKFTGNTFIISEVPKVFQDRNIGKIIPEIVEDLSSNKKISDLDQTTDRMLKFLACRSAIKRGDFIEIEKAKLLISQLESTPNSSTCPHGRPTKVEIKLSQINKSFGR